MFIKQLSTNISTNWFFEFCIEENSPVSKLGKIAFGDYK